MSLYDYVLILLTILGWSISYIAVKFGLEHFPPVLLATLRFSLIAILLLPFYPKTNMNIKHLLLVTLFKSLYHIFIFVGMSKGIDVSTTTIAAQTSVPFSVILSAIFLHEKITKYHVIGMTISFLGIIVILGEPSVIRYFEAFILVIMSALCSAAMNIYMKKVEVNSGLEFVCWSSLTSIIPLFLYSYCTEEYQLPEIVLDAPFSAIMSIICMAIFTSIFSFSTWYNLINKYSVNQIVPFSLLIPIFSIIIATIVFDDVLTSKIMIGGIMTVAGVGVISLFKKTDINE